MIRGDTNATRAGFTLIELMVSMVVMTVGTAALFALQGYVARSNMNAKELTIATSIAENWIERIRTDALNWTAPGEVGTLDSTAYLQDITAVENTWRPPLLTYTTAFGHSPGADLTGAEIANWPPDTESDVLIGYCTNLRFSWQNSGTSIRAYVRVVWPKRPSPASITRDLPGCNNPDDLLDIDGDTIPDYHQVRMSTIVRWTPM